MIVEHPISRHICALVSTESSTRCFEYDQPYVTTRDTTVAKTRLRSTDLGERDGRSRNR